MSKDIYSNVLEKPVVPPELIMLAGDFGFGGVAVDLPSDDCNSVTKSGIYKTKATTFNCPVVDSVDCIVFAMPVSNQIQQQLFYIKGTADLYSRKQGNGSYSTWQKMLFTIEEDTGDANLGNTEVRSKMSFVNPQDQNDTGYIEIENNLIIGNDSSKIELDKTGEISLTANSTKVIIGSQGIATNRNTGSDITNLVQNDYFDPITILAYRKDQAWPLGIYDLPLGREITDFRKLRMYTYFEGNISDMYMYLDLPVEQIDNYPMTFKGVRKYRTWGSLYLQGNTTTTFEIGGSFPGGTTPDFGCLMLVGWLKF